jgi:excisionase family DNA binding protein
MSLRTAEFVSELLSVSKARVYELVRLNLLPAVRIGARQIRFDEEAVAEWIKLGGSLQPATETVKGESSLNLVECEQENAKEYLRQVTKARSS